jgi:hypothetical protein
VAIATTLEGFEDRFDPSSTAPSITCFSTTNNTQTCYVRALHRATRAAVHLEFERHGVNGLAGVGSDHT